MGLGTNVWKSVWMAYHKQNKSDATFHNGRKTLSNHMQEILKVKILSQNLHFTSLISHLLNIISCFCLVTQSCLTPLQPHRGFCNRARLIFHRIPQKRLLEWVAISFSKVLPDPGIKPTFLHWPRDLYHWATREVDLTLYCMLNW